MDTAGVSSLPSPSCPDGQKRRVCYYYDADIANVDYGPKHCMVPRRVDMAHALVRSYGLLGDMKRLRTRPATVEEICLVHAPEYVRVLRELTPEGVKAGGSVRDDAIKFGIGKVVSDDGGMDNPAIAGLWDYCQRYTGGSLVAARALASGEADIAINWSGGMHHACQETASGFCYVNDITLAITELLGHFRRVLYVDIDVHHGDGVEAAFEDSNRVMTVSFHQRTKDFFPEKTGFVTYVGKGEGLYRALNVPMKEGMDDEGYYKMFEPIMRKVMDVFQPEAIVMQCGADSLSGDRLGQLNLSIAGHGMCVSFMRSFNTPLLLLGGGGYTVNHVAACWCYETALAIGKQINDDITSHWYERYYESQGYKLHYPVQARRKNDNSETYMTNTMNTVLEHLSNSKLEAAPSVQFEDPKGGSIDADSLFYDSPPDEEGDPMVILQQQCQERDVRRFLVELGKRQRLFDRGKEAGGSEVVKKHRHRS